MRALICGVDATLARHVSITKCKMPNMRQNLHKFMRLLKRLLAVGNLEFCNLRLLLAGRPFILRANRSRGST
jgi:hypothetical protein